MTQEFKTNKGRGSPIWMAKQRKELLKKQEKKQLQLRMVEKTNNTILNSKEDKTLMDSLAQANAVIKENQDIQE